MQTQSKERWEIDASRSQLRFTLRHIVVSEIQGFFGGWGGEMTVDPDRSPRIQVQAWIDVGSIETGSAERDAHVRSSEFLDTARFPRAQFTSTDVALRNDGAATVTGRLQLHGISRDPELAQWLADAAEEGVGVTELPPREQLERWWAQLQATTARPPANARRANPESG